MELDHLWFEIFALLAAVGGPALGYWAAKRKMGAEVLLINVDTIKGWNDQRKRYEKDISELNVSLSEAEERTRSERVKYLGRIDVLYQEIEELQDKLRQCLSEEDDFLGPNT